MLNPEAPKEIWSRAQRMNADDNLDCFFEGQDHIYEAVLDELRAGGKYGHWMWFIFPQVKGLGNSGTAEKYAITSLEEAKAYLQHPVLGSRLRECTQLVIKVGGSNAMASARVVKKLVRPLRRYAHR